MSTIDCRGLACPGPVIQVKKAMEELSPGDTLEVKVDSDANLENVRRFVESRGGGVQAGKDGESGFLITIVMPEDTETRGHGDAGVHADAGTRGRGDTGVHADAGTRGRGDTGIHGRTDARTHGHTGTAPPVVFIAGDAIGTGDDKLGRILMEGFVNTLLEQESAPDKILLMNGGVRLAAEGSAVLDTLGKLVDLGCEILVCGTCLDYFELKEKLSMGTVSNMYDIQRAMLTASKVIRP